MVAGEDVAPDRTFIVCTHHIDAVLSAIGAELILAESSDLCVCLGIDPVPGAVRILFAGDHIFLIDAVVTDHDAVQESQRAAIGGIHQIDAAGGIHAVIIVPEDTRRRCLGGGEDVVRQSHIRREGAVLTVDAAGAGNISDHDTVDGIDGARTGKDRAGLVDQRGVRQREGRTRSRGNRAFGDRGIDNGSRAGLDVQCGILDRDVLEGQAGIGAGEVDAVSTSTADPDVGTAFHHDAQTIDGDIAVEDHILHIVCEGDRGVLQLEQVHIVQCSGKGGFAIGNFSTGGNFQTDTGTCGTDGTDVAVAVGDRLTDLVRHDRISRRGFGGGVGSDLTVGIPCDRHEHTVVGDGRSADFDVFRAVRSSCQVQHPAVQRGILRVNVNRRTVFGAPAVSEEDGGILQFTGGGVSQLDHAGGVGQVMLTDDGGGQVCSAAGDRLKIAQFRSTGLIVVSDDAVDRIQFSVGIQQDTGGIVSGDRHVQQGCRTRNVECGSALVVGNGAVQHGNRCTGGDIETCALCGGGIARDGAVFDSQAGIAIRQDTAAEAADSHTVHDQALAVRQNDSVLIRTGETDQLQGIHTDSIAIHRHARRSEGLARTVQGDAAADGNQTVDHSVAREGVGTGAGEDHCAVSESGDILIRTRILEGGSGGIHRCGVVVTEDILEGDLTGTEVDRIGIRCIQGAVDHGVACEVLGACAGEGQVAVGESGDRLSGSAVVDDCGISRIHILTRGDDEVAGESDRAGAEVHIGGGAVQIARHNRISGERLVSAGKGQVGVGAADHILRACTIVTIDHGTAEGGTCSPGVVLSVQRQDAGILHFAGHIERTGESHIALIVQSCRLDSTSIEVDTGVVDEGAEDRYIAGGLGSAVGESQVAIGDSGDRLIRAIIDEGSFIRIGVGGSTVEGTAHRDLICAEECFCRTGDGQIVCDGGIAGEGLVTAAGEGQSAVVQSCDRLGGAAVGEGSTAGSDGGTRSVGEVAHERDTVGTEVHRGCRAVQITVDRGCTGEGFCTGTGESQRTVGESCDRLSGSAIVCHLDLADIHLAEVAHGAAQRQAGIIREGDFGIACIECGIHIQIAIDREGTLGEVQFVVLIRHQDLTGCSGEVVDRTVQGAVCRSPGSGSDRIVEIQGRILVQRDLGCAEGRSTDRLDRVVTGQGQVSILACDNRLRAVAVVDDRAGDRLICIPAVVISTQREGTAVVVDGSGLECAGEGHLAGVGQSVNRDRCTVEDAAVVQSSGIDRSAVEDAAVGEGTGDIQRAGGSLDGFCRTGQDQVSVGGVGINGLVCRAVIDRGAAAVDPVCTADDRKCTGDIDNAVIGQVISIAIIQDEGGAIGNIQCAVNDQLVERDCIHDIHGGTGRDGDRLCGLVSGQSQSPAFRLHPCGGILGNFKDTGLTPGVVIVRAVFDGAVVISVKDIVRQSRSVCTGHRDITAEVAQLIGFDLRDAALVGKRRTIQTVPGQDAAVIGTLEGVAAISCGAEDDTVLDRIEGSIRSDFEDTVAAEDRAGRTEDRGVGLSGQVVETGPGIGGSEDAVIRRRHIRCAGEDGVVSIRSAARCDGHDLAAADCRHVGEVCHHVFVDRDSALGERGIDEVRSYCSFRFRRSRETHGAVPERGVLHIEVQSSHMECGIIQTGTLHAHICTGDREISIVRRNIVELNGIAACRHICTILECHIVESQRIAGEVDHISGVSCAIQRQVGQQERNGVIRDREYGFHIAAVDHLDGNACTAVDGDGGIQQESTEGCQIDFHFRNTGSESNDFARQTGDRCNGFTERCTGIRRRIFRRVHFIVTSGHGSGVHLGRCGIGTDDRIVFRHMTASQLVGQQESGAFSDRAVDRGRVFCGRCTGSSVDTFFIGDTGNKSFRILCHSDVSAAVCSGCAGECGIGRAESIADFQHGHPDIVLQGVAGEDLGCRGNGVHRISVAVDIGHLRIAVIHFQIAVNKDVSIKAADQRYFFICAIAEAQVCIVGMRAVMVVCDQGVDDRNGFDPGFRRDRIDTGVGSDRGVCQNDRGIVQTVDRAAHLTGVICEGGVHTHQFTAVHIDRTAVIDALCTGNRGVDHMQFTVVDVDRTAVEGRTAHDCDLIQQDRRTGMNEHHTAARKVGIRSSALQGHAADLQCGTGTDIYQAFRCRHHTGNDLAGKRARTGEFHIGTFCEGDAAVDHQSGIRSKDLLAGSLDFQICDGVFAGEGHICRVVQNEFIIGRCIDRLGCRAVVGHNRSGCVDEVRIDRGIADGHGTGVVHHICAHIVEGTAGDVQFAASEDCKGCGIRIIHIQRTAGNVHCAVGADGNGTGCLKGSGSLVQGGKAGHGQVGGVQRTGVVQGGSCSICFTADQVQEAVDREGTAIQHADFCTAFHQQRADGNHIGSTHREGGTGRDRKFGFAVEDLTDTPADDRGPFAIDRPDFQRIHSLTGGPIRIPGVIAGAAVAIDNGPERVIVEIAGINTGVSTGSGHCRSTGGFFTGLVDQDRAVSGSVTDGGAGQIHPGYTVIGNCQIKRFFVDGSQHTVLVGDGVRTKGQHIAEAGELQVIDHSAGDGVAVHHIGICLTEDIVGGIDRTRKIGCSVRAIRGVAHEDGVRHIHIHAAALVHCGTAGDLVVHDRRIDEGEDRIGGGGGGIEDVVAEGAVVDRAVDHGELAGGLIFTEGDQTSAESRTVDGRFLHDEIVRHGFRIKEAAGDSAARGNIQVLQDHIEIRVEEITGVVAGDFDIIQHIIVCNIFIQVHIAQVQSALAAGKGQTVERQSNIGTVQLQVPVRSAAEGGVGDRDIRPLRNESALISLHHRQSGIDIRCTVESGACCSKRTVLERGIALNFDRIQRKFCIIGGQIAIDIQFSEGNEGIVVESLFHLIPVFVFIIVDRLVFNKHIAGDSGSLLRIRSFSGEADTGQVITGNIQSLSKTVATGIEFHIAVLLDVQFSVRTNSQRDITDRGIMIDHGGIFRAFHAGIGSVADHTIHHNTCFTVGHISLCIIDQAVTVVNDRIVDEDIGITIHKHISSIARIGSDRIFFQDLGSFHDQRTDLNGRSFIDVQHIARTDREGGESARCFHTPAFHIHILLGTFQPVFKTCTVELLPSESIFHIPVNNHIFVTDNSAVFNDGFFLGTIFRCQEDIACQIPVPCADSGIIRTACTVLVVNRVEVIAAEGIDTGSECDERIFVDPVIHLTIHDLHLDPVPVRQRGRTECQDTVVVDMEVMETGLLNDLRDLAGIKHLVDAQTIVGVSAGFLAGNDFFALDNDFAGKRVSIGIKPFLDDDISSAPDRIHAIRTVVAHDDGVQDSDHGIRIFHHNTAAAGGRSVSILVCDGGVDDIQ